MPQPFFTVAIPVWNRLGFIKESTKSVFDQTFKDFELIIVDDASTDGTWEYIQTISDPRVKVFRNPQNAGVVHNWRCCLEKATGKWFKFLLSDDLMLPDALYILKQIIEENPGNNVIVNSGIGFNDEVEIKQYMGIKNREIRDTWKYLQPMDKIIQRRKRYNYTWATPNAYTLLTEDLIDLFDTEEYKEIERLFGRSGHCTDYYILYAVALKYKTMIEMDFPLYGSRCHDSNMSKYYYYNLTYHLGGDKYINYKLFNYKGFEHLFTIRHAFRIYFHKIRSNKKILLKLILFRMTGQLIVFLFRHIFGIDKNIDYINCNVPKK